MFSTFKKTFSTLKSALPWAKRKTKSLYDDPNNKKWVKDSFIRYIKSEVAKFSLKWAIECYKDYSWIVFMCNMILLGMNLYVCYPYFTYPIK